MSPIRALVVDDEPLAREVIVDLLAEDPEIDCIGESGDGEHALETIRTLRPDLVFLDVEMPGQGGIAVAEALSAEELPVLIFITAFGHYAIPAFEVAALDYLVKPFSDRRFTEALERAKQRIRERRLGDLAEQMVAFGSRLDCRPDPPPIPDPTPGGAEETESTEAAEPMRRIRVQTRGRSRILKVTEVVWIESEDYYSRIHTGEETFLVRISLASFERSLDPRAFLRVHRRAIVRIDEVEAIDHLFKGACAVVLSDGSRLPVSRARKKNVLEILAPRASG